MRTNAKSRLLLLALAAALVFPAAALADCNYTFTWTDNGSTLTVRVVSDCGVHTVDRTRLMVNPGNASSSQYGTFAQVTVADPAGSQLFCADAVATFWDGPFLAIDEGRSECRVF